jgi:hypothetical protein
MVKIINELFEKLNSENIKYSTHNRSMDDFNKSLEENSDFDILINSFEADKVERILIKKFHCWN